MSGCFLCLFWVGSERFRGFGVQQFGCWVCGLQVYLRRGVMGRLGLQFFFVLGGLESGVYPQP